MLTSGIADGATFDASGSTMQSFCTGAEKRYASRRKQRYVCTNEKKTVFFSPPFTSNILSVKQVRKCFTGLAGLLENAWVCRGNLFIQVKLSAC
jgi:hypothetical protein